MSDSPKAIHDIKCFLQEKYQETFIDFRHFGVLEESILPDLLNLPNTKRILIYHDSIADFLYSDFVKLLSSNITVEIFDQCHKDHPNSERFGDKFLWKTCQIEVNERGIIKLDLQCKALKRQQLKFSLQNKVRQLILRDYEDGVLGNNGIFDCLVELIIRDGKPGDVPLEYHKDIYHFPYLPFKVRLDRRLANETNLPQSIGCSQLFLAHMQNLKRLFLSTNGKKILPKGLDKLCNLKELFIVDNPIQNDFISQLSLTNINALVLYNCGLKVFPDAVNEIKQLEILECPFNSFKDQVVSLSALRKLKRLALKDCELNVCPQGLEELEYLDLSFNNLNKCLTTMPVLSNLKGFTAEHSKITALPESLNDMKNLNIIRLSENDHLGHYPGKISKLINLNKLVMMSCGLRRLPRGLAQCSQLQVLNFGGNRALGQNPENEHEIQSLGGLTKLKELDLSMCGFRRLPRGLGQLSHLEVLNLHDYRPLDQNPENDHEIQGLCGLMQLKKLDLSNRGLQGLPRGLGQCTQLEVLRLGGNIFGDNLDNDHEIQSLGGLTKLKEFDLNRCGFRRLPRELG